MPGAALKATYPSRALGHLRRPVGAEIAVAGSPGPAGGEPGHRPPGHQRGPDVRPLAAHGQHRPEHGGVLLAPPPPSSMPPAPSSSSPRPASRRLRRRRLLLRHGLGEAAEAIIGYLQAVGIRAKLRPSSAPPSTRASPTRSSATWSRSSRAPRAMPPPGSRRMRSRAAPSPTAAIPTSTGSSASRRPSSIARARGHPPPNPAARPRASDGGADLRARLPHGRGPAPRGVRPRPHPGYAFSAPVRGRQAQGERAPITGGWRASTGKPGPSTWPARPLADGHA